MVVEVMFAVGRSFDEVSAAAPAVQWSELKKSCGEGQSFV